MVATKRRTDVQTLCVLSRFIFLSVQLKINIRCKSTLSSVPKGFIILVIISSVIFGNPEFHKKIQCLITQGKTVCQNQLDPCSHFDTVPACDRHTDTHKHRPKDNTTALAEKTHFGSDWVFDADDGNTRQL